jgi:hypothetical protein
LCLFEKYNPFYRKVHDRRKPYQLPEDEEEEKGRHN